MHTLRYAWLHIPTGTRGTREVEACYPLGWAETELKARLDRWNAQQPGIWQYWSL